MKEQWIEHRKKADFSAWAQALNVTPVTARIIRNRGCETLEEAKQYLYGTIDDLADPFLMKDMREGAFLVCEALRQGTGIAISSDFDDDGIFAGEILYEGLKKIGGNPMLFAPNRVREGYGINRRIIDEAKAKGCGLILTCDNGIAALEEVRYAKEIGMKVVVTDHHEVQYEDHEETRTYLVPEADAVIDPHRPGDEYPFKSLCGAGVAYRLMEVLFQMAGRSADEVREYLEYAAIATVADVVELTGENRIIVREGLKQLTYTKNTGLQALIRACALQDSAITSYHIGFVLGPCFNAVGRLSDVRKAFDLLQEKDPEKAVLLAAEIRELNLRRQAMTEEGVQEAVRQVEETEIGRDRVLVIALENAHESVVGIIAGKIKEKYNRPTFVFTKTESGMKGSGRSIPEYDMLENLMKCRNLMIRGGGHKMAAGLTVAEEDLEPFRRKINEVCSLTEEDLQKKIYVDALMPLSYVTEEQIRELDLIQPCGTGNTKPLFARPHFKIRSMRYIGAQQDSLKFSVSDGSGAQREAVFFKRAGELTDFFCTEYGTDEVDKAVHGRQNALDAAFIYTPSVNEYRGNRTIQIRIESYCKIS